MNRRTLAWTLTGLLLTVAPLTALARGRSQGGCAQPNCPQVQTQTGDRTQLRQRLRDGSCAGCPSQGAGTTSRRGNRFGPGNGTGNGGSGPQDGTGNGAPSNP